MSDKMRSSNISDLDKVWQSVPVNALNGQKINDFLQIGKIDFFSFQQGPHQPDYIEN